MEKKTIEEQLDEGYENLKSFKESIELKGDDIENEIKWWRRAGFTSIIVGLVFFIVPFFLPEYGKIAFNEYGDFVGGVVASLWSLAGLMFIYVAFLGQKHQLLIQQLELRHTQVETLATRVEISGQREELKQQNETLFLQRFESTFFSLLASRRELMRALKVSDGLYGNFEGTDVIEYINIKLKQRLSSIVLNGIITKENIHILRDQYFKVTPNSSNAINLFLDSLLSVLEFTAYSDLLENDDERRTYFSIIASQLTIAERTFLYYYLCIDLSTGQITHNHYHRIEEKFRFVSSREVAYFHPSHQSLFGWWVYLHSID